MRLKTKHSFVCFFACRLIFPKKEDKIGCFHRVVVFKTIKNKRNIIRVKSYIYTNKYR